MKRAYRIWKSNCLQHFTVCWFYSNIAEALDILIPIYAYIIAATHFAPILAIIYSYSDICMYAYIYKRVLSFVNNFYKFLISPFHRATSYKWVLQTCVHFNRLVGICWYRILHWWGVVSLFSHLQSKYLRYTHIPT